MFGIDTFCYSVCYTPDSKKCASPSLSLDFGKYLSFLVSVFLIFFFTVLSKYDKEMRNLLKTDKLAQENSEIFGTVLSFLDDFIWISALIVAIEVVVALLAARSLLTDGNINWFIRTRFYAVLGFIFTAPACIIVCTVRPLKKLAEIPIGHKTLWWLITGCLTVLIFTYSKQIFDERIFPQEKRDVTKDEKTGL